MTYEMMEAALWSFDHFYHMDKANATMHLAPVRFSPITFRLAYVLLDAWSDDPLTPELIEVREHIGQYELDPGR